ncbi:DUF3842 family protein [Ruminococcaceae bacterium OttesenSCG-928-N02]|nr:DUF3842 family protein [Ruminococcaceae bacterium OttesenSCG-928-N02]
MNILVIDGQGGKMGKALVEQLREACPQATLTAVGTNSIATSVMLQAGAQQGATGENPVMVNAMLARYIVGPIGILTPNALLGEITPAMAAAVGASGAKKVLIPANQCGVHVVGTKKATLKEYVRQAVEYITNDMKEAQQGG